MSSAFFRPRPQLLSFDIFGFALSPMVLEPDDVHRLVAALLRRKASSAVDDYVRARRRAEASAREAAAAVGRQDIALADVRDRLGALLLDHAERAGGRGPEIASLAISTEVEFEQLVWVANPDALDLYREARASGVPVAFVADSPLPRDLVAKMLQKAGFHEGHVLVSSHEGATKRTGLYTALVARADVAPSQITHMGPDPIDDIAYPAEVGLASMPVTAGRGHVLDRFLLGLTPRTGVDSIAIALAADRFAEAEHRLDGAEVGYYASGPMLAGFGAWIGRLIDERDPDHVVFCGPSARLLRQVTAIVRPDLAFPRLRDLDRPTGESPSRVDVARLAADLNLGLADRVLAVDLGWDDQPHRWLGPMLLDAGHQVDVSGAYLGVEGPPDDGRAVAWAFDGSLDDPVSAAAIGGIDVLRALVPTSHPRLARPNHTGPYGDALPLLAGGVRSFAEAFHEWLRLERHDTTPAMLEPALRVAASPTWTEANLLGHYRTPSSSVPLASLALDAEQVDGAGGVARSAVSAPWRRGYAALVEGNGQLTSSTRLLRRGRRRSVRS